MLPIPRCVQGARRKQSTQNIKCQLSLSVLTPRASSPHYDSFPSPDLARILSLAFAGSALCVSFVCVVSILVWSTCASNPPRFATLQDHEAADEGSQNSADHGESLVVNANSRSGALGATAAAALGRGTGRGGVGAGLGTSRVG